MIKKIGTLLFGCLIGAVLVLVLPQFLESSSLESNAKTDIDLSVLKESMEENNELSTAQYFYTNSIAITDQNTLAIIGRDDIALPFTDATYILKYDGTIKAGYDLSDVQPENVDGKIVVTLPKPEILSHSTDDVEVIYEQQNIMNPLKAGEESNWISDQKDKMEERAVSLGLYDEAERTAKATFESLYAPAIPDGTTLVIKFQNEAEDK